MTPSYLVQILLPKETGRGERVLQEWFEHLLKELTDEFGGATSFVRTPGQGLWQRGGGTERDSIAIVEVMADHLLTDYWRALGERLETELGQEEIVVRAQEIVTL
ncbi:MULTISPECIES: hypothetical protein [unclassified Bradyrhizobium]|uniref:hypothetical protein n=1 Tax=unclassified Bradyrhizobium TaxID=2631580 RepID=UPI0020B40828|nr:MULTISPECIES: hypothetical protein [unclassified Bradyrhizobium]MCP3398940.1 hypothetical protein [Bradyrhizobium sp. CCGB20]MCP3407541.1 hypothetical protein [Bradyrhizobium sp. CCGB01]